MNDSLRRSGATLAVLLGIAVQGCNYLGTARDFDPEELRTTTGWTSVDNVPYVAQATREDCGIAAIEMVFSHYGKTAAREEIVKNCPVEPGTGSRAKDLRDFARSQGFQAFLIHGELSDFQTELSRGHPVMVGVIKPFATGAVTHYEVAVAIHPERQQIVTLDPANGWRSNSFEGFLKEWTAAGRLTLLVFPETPAGARRPVPAAEDTR